MLDLSENFRWTEQLTAILVKQCYQKKTDFQNPKMRKSDLFKDIVEHFKELGHYVTTRILYQKYCNIKGTYIRIVRLVFGTKIHINAKMNLIHR